MELTASALSWLCRILEERFGHPFKLIYDDSDSLVMHLEGLRGKVSFSKTSPIFFKPQAVYSCTHWEPEGEGFHNVLGGKVPAPCIDQLTYPLIKFKVETQQAIVGYDILGLVYWMLNRIEEIGHTDLDKHGRFPATRSHAFKNGYLERPVVDEWLHILGQVIERVWPGIELKKHQFSMKVSHDVDSPSLYSFKPWKSIFRMMAGHLLKRKDLKAFVQAPWIKLTTSNRLHELDPFNTFDWLMDLSERNNLVSAFYFICGRTSNMDADYEIEHPIIKDLMQKIHKRGHEIGLHPSYGTYQKAELLKKEADRLRAACDRVGVTQSRFGGRMHYLRWEHPTTLQAWEDAGMAYDTTLSYADRPGFRCGTCFEYPAFNPISQKDLQIRIRPLIAMECTVIDSIYLGLGNTEAAEYKFLELKETCRKLGGCFTILWHNSYFANKAGLKEMYQRILEG